MLLLSIERLGGLKQNGKASLFHSVTNQTLACANELAKAALAPHAGFNGRFPSHW
jgi:hypothetical protein